MMVRQKASTVVLLVFAMIGLYVLSVGPAMSLICRGLIPEEVIKVYEPVLRCIPEHGVVSDAFLWYVSACGWKPHGS